MLGEPIRTVFSVVRAAVVAGFHPPRLVPLVPPQQDRATLAGLVLVLGLLAAAGVVLGQ